MSYDLYLVVGETERETVFNASIFNMPAFLNRVIDALAAKVKRVQYDIRNLESQRYRALNPEYVQGERYSDKPDNSWARHLSDVIVSNEEFIKELEASQAAWVQLETGAEVNYVDLCMAFTFDCVDLEGRENEYARCMLSSLGDCARFHGNCNAYVA